METSRVAEFRRCILEGAWKEAEEALEHLGVAEDDGLWVWFHCAQLNERCVLIHRAVSGGEIPYQSTEISRILRDRQDSNGITRVAKRTCAPPHGSRTATATFKVCRYNTSRYLEFLRASSTSSLIMCLDAADLKHKAGWDGAHGSSRRRLLVNLQSGSTFHKYLSQSINCSPRLYSFFPHDPSSAFRHAAGPSAVTPDFSMRVSQRTFNFPTFFVVCRPYMRHRPVSARYNGNITGA